MIVWADTREQQIPPFPPGVVVERRMMKEGDYSTEALFEVARIERKSVSDLASTLSWGRERFDREVQRLQGYRWKCVVCEGDPSTLYRTSGMHVHSILGSLASLYARWVVPTLFVGSPAAAGRLIAGLLKRWEERHLADQSASAAPAGGRAA